MISHHTLILTDTNTHTQTHTHSHTHTHTHTHTNSHTYRLMGVVPWLKMKLDGVHVKK